MSSFNGIGTTLYGKSDIRQDGSFVSTKWLIFLLLPIIPLGSFRVYFESKTELINPLFYIFKIIGGKRKFYLEEVNLNKKQILRTYLVAYGMLGIFGLLIYLITKIPDKDWDTILNYPLAIVIALMFFALGIIYFFNDKIH